MQPDDWIKRWQDNRIAFHETSVNAYLARYLADFKLSPGAGIFMPLCGKSRDIAWLAQQGYSVTGIELSELALEAFFAEQGLNYQRFESEHFKLYSSTGIRLLLGDFFDLQAEDLGDCELVYDRAALIAIDTDNRQRYCDHMRSLLPKQAQILLITLEYPQAQMAGPPFAVTSAQVEACYGPYYEIELLDQADVLDEQPRWRAQGLTALQEVVYRLRPRS